MLVDFGHVKELLSPVRAGHAQLGRNIHANMPDVEVLVGNLQEIPTTLEAFRAKAGDRDWCIVALYVLGVGPPGFSSVPYTSSKKKGDVELNPLPLYDTGEHNLTRFYSFEKGKTNRDRGKRVDRLDPQDEGGGMTATHTLKPGTTFNFFLREEMFADKRDFFAGWCPQCGVLPPMTTFYAQFAGNNVDAVAKGSFFKLKRLQYVQAPQTVVAPFLQKLPQSLSQAQTLQEQCAQLPTVSRQAYQGNINVFALSVHPEAYMVYEGGGEDKLVLVNADEQGIEIAVSSAVAMQAFKTDKREHMERFLNIAIASGALSCLVTTAVKDPILGNGRSYEAVLMHIDVNAFLNLSQIDTHDDWPCKTDGTHGLQMHCMEDGTIVWCNTPDVITAHDNKKYNIVFTLESAVSELSAPWNDSSDAFITDGGQGPFHMLQVYLAGRDVPVSEFGAASSGRHQHVLDLQLRPQNRCQGGSVPRKRARITGEMNEDADLYKRTRLL